MNEINKRLRSCRLIAGLKQKDFADCLGVKINTYSQKERIGNITCEDLVKISKIIDLDIYYVLYGIKREEMFPPSEEPKPITEQIGIFPPPSPKELTLIEMFRHLTVENRNYIMETTYELIMIVVCQNAEKRIDKPLFKWLYKIKLLNLILYNAHFNG